MAKSEFRILLVDDYPMVRTMLRTGLNEMGYQDIDEADDGREALDKLRAAHAAGRPFDLVFCDWVMPVMEGIAVLEECRATKDFKYLPFVMVTAEAERESIVRALKAGATDYILKPISTKDLQDKMQVLLAKMKRLSA